MLVFVVVGIYSLRPQVGVVEFWWFETRGANDASRVRVRLSSSRVVNISSRARARVELTRAELDSTR